MYGCYFFQHIRIEINSFSYILYYVYSPIFGILLIYVIGLRIDPCPCVNTLLTAVSDTRLSIWNSFKKLGKEKACLETNGVYKNNIADFYLSVYFHG